MKLGGYVIAFYLLENALVLFLRAPAVIGALFSFFLLIGVLTQLDVYRRNQWSDMRRLSTNLVFLLRAHLWPLFLCTEPQRTRP